MTETEPNIEQEHRAEFERQREAHDKEEAVLERIRELIGMVDSLWLLNGIYRNWEDRMKELAAVVLKPGTDEVLDEYDGALAALDYIWDLHGDYSFKGGQSEPFRPRALDYYVGRKFRHVWGTGELVKLSKDGEHPPRYGVRVRLACGTEGCKNKITVYAAPGCHNGAFCYVYDREGNYLADLRNQWFKCNSCSKRGKK